MPPHFIQSANTVESPAIAGGTTSVTLSSAPQDGALLVVYFGTTVGDAAVTSITQTGATWNSIASTGNNFGAEGEMWYAYNVPSTAATLIDVAWTGSAQKANLVVVEYAGIETDGDPLTFSTSSEFGSATSTTVVAPNLSSDDNDLVVIGFSHGTTGGAVQLPDFVSADSGFVGDGYSNHYAFLNETQDTTIVSKVGDGTSIGTTATFQGSLYRNGFVRAHFNGLLEPTDTRIIFQDESGITADRLRAVAYTSNGALGRFCAVGDNTGRIVTSPDGYTWTDRGQQGVNLLLGITANTAGTLWVAGGGDGDSTTAPEILTSPDGIVWTSRTTNLIGAYVRDIYHDGTTYVAVGDSGQIATSSDAITWTSRNSNAPNNILLSVTKLGSLWVAAGNSDSVTLGGAGSILVSGDAVNWMSIDLADIKDDDNQAINAVQRLAVGDGKIVATGNVGNIFSSTDGYTWVKETPPRDLRPEGTYTLFYGDGAFYLTGSLTGSREFVFKGTGSSGSMEWKEIFGELDSTDRARGAVYNPTQNQYVYVGDSGLIRVGLLNDVAIAANPDPLDQPKYGTPTTTIDPTSVSITWAPAPGNSAGTQEVFFGTDPTTLASVGTFGGTITGTSAGALANNTTYYWRVDTIDNNTTYTGDVWHFVTDPAGTLSDTELTIVRDEDQLFTGTFDFVSTTPTVVSTIPSASLIHGHRYLVLGNMHYVNNTYTPIIRLNINDGTNEFLAASNLANHYVYERDETSSGRGKYFSFADVITPIAGESINVQIQRSGSGSNIAVGSRTLISIDLDAPGLEENKDWFHAKNVSAMENPATGFSVNNYCLDLEFTPDGYSDYLVLFHGIVDNITSTLTIEDANFRVRDTVSGDVIMNNGQRNFLFSPNPWHSHFNSAVLKAPSATTRSLRVEYYTDDTNDQVRRHRQSSLFVLRLNKFEQFAHAFEDYEGASDVPSTFPPTSGAEVFASTTFKPGASGNWLTLGTTEFQPSAGDRGLGAVIAHGLAGSPRIWDSDGASLGGSPSSTDYGVIHRAGDGNYRGMQVGLRYLVGTQADTFRGLDYYLVDSNALSTEVYNVNLTAFTQEYAVAPQVYWSEPTAKSKADPSTNIKFLIASPNSVDTGTIDIDVGIFEKWKFDNISLTENLQDAYFNPVQARWVTVGANDTIYRSDNDGYSWSSVASPTSGINLRSLAHDGTTWVAVGNGGTVITSPDGISWTSRTSNTGNDLYKVISVGNQFIAVGNSGTIITSPDGITAWTVRTSGTAERLRGVAFGNGTYVAVGDQNTRTTSADSIAWASGTGPLDVSTHDLASIDFDGTNFITGAIQARTANLYRSSNGTAWTRLNSATEPNIAFRDISYADGTWLAVGFQQQSGYQESLLYTSFDGGDSWFKAYTDVDTRMISNATVQKSAYGEGRWRSVVSGKILRSGSNGIGTFEDALTNGLDEPGYTTSGIPALPTAPDDGYTLVINRLSAYPSDSRIYTVVENAESGLGDTMEPFTEEFLVKADALSVIVKKTNHDATLAITSTGATILTIDSSELTIGHRYMVMAHVGTIGSGSRNRFELQFGGVSDGNVRGRYQPGTDHTAWTPMTLWTAVADQDITVFVDAENGNSNVFNGTLMAIDMDSNSTLFVEGADWFHNVNSTREPFVYFNFTPRRGYFDIGSLTGSDLVDGETFTMTDGTNIETFEFDSGGGVSGGNTAIPFTGGDSQTTVRNAIQSAVNGLSWVTATTTGADILFNHQLDEFQTITVTDTVTTGDFVVSGIEHAALEFTPDGTSDYLVIGNVSLDNGGGLKHEIARIRNLTGGAIIAQAGIGSGNLGTEEHSHTMIGVMEQPAPVAQQLITDYRTFSNWQKDEARIIVIRLQAFQHALFSYQDLNSVPGSAGSDINVASLGFDGYAARSQDLLWFADFKSQAGTSFNSSARGISGRIEFDGDVLFDSQTPFSGDYYTNNDNYNGDQGGHVGPTIFDHVVSVAGGERTLDGIVRAAAATTDNTLRRMTLVGMGTSFQIGPPSAATLPDPADTATDILRAVTLTWTPGTLIAGSFTQNIYFGSNESDVMNGTGGTLQGNFPSTTASFVSPALAANTTYYWRIEGVGDNGTQLGDTWGFTTVAPPTQANNPTPTNAATLVDINQDLTWVSGTSGVGTVEHDVYFGIGAEIFQGRQAGTTFDPGTLAPNIGYNWRIDEYGPGGITTGASWTFTTAPLPGQASAPIPFNGEVGVDAAQDLMWTAGSNTTSYDVYFGLNPDPSGDFQGNQAGTTYDPGTLTSGETYYWRIDPVGPGGTTTGTVWSFVGPPPTLLNQVSPTNGAINQSVTPNLIWIPFGSDDVNVYFSDSYAAVDTASAGAIVATGAGFDFFQPPFIGQYTVTPSLNAGTTYYWRIGHFNDGGETLGPVFDFETVPPPPDPAIRPDPGIGATSPGTDGYNLTLSWEFEPNSTYADWFFGTDPGSLAQIGNNVASTVTSFEQVVNSGIQYYWRIDPGGSGGQTTGTLWNFFGPPPDQAVVVSPTNGETDVFLFPVTLTWTIAGHVDDVTVYFSDSMSAVVNGDLSAQQLTQGLTSYDPGTLQGNTTYYWRIDTENESGTTEGQVWSFTTLDPMAPVLQNANPDDGYVEVDRSTLVVFELATAENVACESVDVEIKLGDAAYVSAIDDGYFQYPYDGPLSSKISTTGLDTITIDSLSIYPRGTIITVRVTATSNFGQSIMNVTYSFKTIDRPSGPGVVLINSSRSTS